MPPDHSAAAVVPLQSQQLRKQAGREQAGVPPDAVVAQGHQPVRMAAVDLYQPLHTVPPQQRLIRHLKQHRIHVLHMRHTQSDGVAESQVGPGILHRQKAHLPGQLHALGVLGHHRHPGKARHRHSLQGTAQQGLSLHPGVQLVAAEAAGISRRHDNASNFHRITSVPSCYLLLSIFTDAPPGHTPPAPVYAPPAL